jgi:single-stranded-DNA-specific exonuclease
MAAVYHPVPKKVRLRTESHPYGSLNSVSDLKAHLLRSRGYPSGALEEQTLSDLPMPSDFKEMASACELLVKIYDAQDKIIIVGDYDADGATATALMVKGLRALGFTNVGYLVPNRFEFGYGLSSALVEKIALAEPKLIITVDNGITSFDGVEAAKSRGIQIIITDHHLPGQVLPKADAILNPQCETQSFRAKNLAGVGVAFYLLLGLRQMLRSRGAFQNAGSLGPQEPNLGELLDLVALGTIADLAPLDPINRILVQAGLKRIRTHKSTPGIQALIAIASRNPERMTSNDLAFHIAPRLNAAGRLQDMTAGIECLLSRETESAQQLARVLDQINQERRKIEEKMNLEAQAAVDRLPPSQAEPMALCLFDAGWHQGLTGLVASKLKERLNCPCIAFAPDNEVPGRLKGSGRSTSNIHIRDILAEIDSASPGLIEKFGGHAMAAGLTIPTPSLESFKALFIEKVRAKTSATSLENVALSDADLDASILSVALVDEIEHLGPWGQGFPEPSFYGEFEVLNARILKERHIRFILAKQGQTFDAIVFGVKQASAWLRARDIQAVYRVEANEFRGQRNLQLRIEYMQANIA